MITNVLQSLKDRLNEFIKEKLCLEQDIVSIQLPEENPSEIKVSLSIINIEKENLTNTVYNRNEKLKEFKYKSPFCISLNTLIAVSSNNQKYFDTIKVLETILYFFQLKNIIEDKANNVFNLELCNINTGELNNMWSVAKGTNYPFIVVKIRNIIISNDLLVENKMILKIEI